MNNDNALFYTCSLVEFIGRECKLKRSEVIKLLGDNVIRRIYSRADVLHCEVIASVADTFIKKCNLPIGNFDNVAKCKYEIPDYWTIGEVYKRLIEDVNSNRNNEDIIDTAKEVYTSWIDKFISNYNSDFFYQSRDYIAECYQCGKVLG